jgi:GntR family transcriptional regulator
MAAVAGGSIYAALAQRGLTVHHGVATITPDVAMGEVAKRLAVPRGTLLLTVWQVDSTADDTVALVSREHHLADAFEISVYRRGPGDVGEEER